MTTAKIRVVKHNGFFVVSTDDPGVLSHLHHFDRRFTTYKFKYDYQTRKTIRVRDAVYSAGNRIYGEFRFNIGSLQEFALFIKEIGYRSDEIDFSEKAPPRADKINIQLRPEFTPWEKQKPFIHGLVKKDKKPYKLVDLQTGKGKGLISIASLARLGRAILILIRPGYSEKWILELTEKLDVTRDDIMTVNGSDELNEVLNNSDKHGMRKPITIISNTTFRNYINEYEVLEEPDDFGYDYYPYEVTKILKIGTVLIDETHEEFHAVFKACLYLDVHLVIGLSATLDSDDKKVRTFQHIMYPDNARLSFMEYHRYATLVHVNFKLRNPRRVRPMKKMGYSHIKLEQDIMRDSHLLKGYIDMIDYFLKKGYIDRKLPGEKALIFAQTIDLCTYIQKILQQRYPELNVQRYVGEDDFENIMQGDITVSTPLSSGTAIDIKGLISVYQTVSVKSTVANLQHLGRLREIPGREVRFYYFYSFDIKKQADYHFRRMEIFRDRVANAYRETYHKPI